MSAKLQQPSSLYDLSFAKFVSTLKPPDTISSNYPPQLDYLPHTIQRDFYEKATVCSICAKIRIDKTFRITFTTNEMDLRDSRVCNSCLGRFECWACARRIDATEYLDFVNEFTTLQMLNYIPAIMTNYIRNDEHLTLCYRCDGFFWPCDYCGAWINEA